MNARPAPSSGALSPAARASRALLGLLLVSLLACEGTEEPSVKLTVLDPVGGAVGASLTVELVLTGRVGNAWVKVWTPSMPSTPLRVGECRATCTMNFQLPSGTFEFQGILVPQAEDGSDLPEMTTERLSVTIDSRPLTTVQIPSFSGSDFKVLFLRDVVASSITPETVKLTRRVQTGFGAKAYVEEPVAATLRLEGRILNVTGDTGGPALLTLRIDGVRDVPGNRAVATFTTPRTFFRNGPDVREFINTGRMDRLRRDTQGRLHHLTRGGAWRLTGPEWMPLATWTQQPEQEFDLDPSGAPVKMEFVFSEEQPPGGGPSYSVRSLQVQRWDGGAFVDMGAPLPAGNLFGDLGLPFALRMDPQGRPVVALTEYASQVTTLRLLRFNGTTWETLSPKLNTASGQYEASALNLGGGGSGPVIVGWVEGVGAQRRHFLRRVEADGTLTPLEPPNGGTPDWETLTYDTAGRAILAATAPSNPYVTLVFRRTATGWEPLGAPGEPNQPGVITALTTDPTGAPVVFTVLRNQNGSTNNDPGDPYGGSTPNVYTTMSGYRHDGQKWGPLTGATHPILETQQAPWMSNAPADFALGDSTVALAAHYLPNGTLWMLKLRGRTDFSTGGAGTARSYLLRASHAP